MKLFYITEYNNIDCYIYNKIDQLINNIDFVNFDILFDNYLKIQKEHSNHCYFNQLLNSIIDRIIYQFINIHIYENIDIDIIYVCNHILKYYINKSNPDIYDLRIKSFCQQFILQYNFFKNSNELNSNIAILLSDININQSLFYHNINNKYIQNDIILLYNHFFSHYNYVIKKINIFDLSNFIGSFFITNQSINTITLFIINNINCDNLFIKINNLNIDQLNEYINKVNEFEICNSNTFIFYITYTKLCIENYNAYKNNNIITICQNYRYLITNSIDHYFHYLNGNEKYIGCHNCIVLILKCIINSLHCCIEFIHYYHMNNDILPEYIYHIALKCYKKYLKEFKYL